MKNKSIIYQVLPRYWGGHFENLDNDFLDYVKWLGCTHVWYTGVPRHTRNAAFMKGSAGSPYAISDWFDVNPYLATDEDCRMEEFEALVSRTHQAGLKVIIDFIPNHVARDYKSSRGESLGEHDDTSVHWSAGNDFYYYPGEALVLPQASGKAGEPATWNEFPAKASGNAFTPHPGVNDWYETVRLNYCPFHTGTWDKMLEVLRFWAAKGVDGFRCDMVEMVPAEFMQWAIKKTKAEFPDLIFIAEVYNHQNYSKYLHEVGFDLLYDKTGMYDTLRAVVCGFAPASNITSVWQSLDCDQSGLLNFLENHDEQRIASGFFAGSGRNALCALGVSALFSGASHMIYYGQEIGERGMDAEGFSGLDGRTTIFDWWNIEAIDRLREAIRQKAYIDCSVAPLKDAGLSTREAELLLRYRQVLSLCGSTPAFGTEGSIHDLMYVQDAGFDRRGIFAFLRYNSTDVYLVAANFTSAKRKFTVRIPECLRSEHGLDESYEMTCPAMDFSILQTK